MRGFFPTTASAKTPNPFATAAILAVLFLLGTGGCTERPRIPNDTAVMLVENAPRSLDPLRATDAVSQKINNLLHAGLVRIGTRMEVVSELAASWEVSKYRKFHFKLRPGLKFHDGTPLTAVDVVRVFEEYRANSPHADAFKHVTGFKAIGNLDVRFETAVPQPFLLADFPVIKIFKRVSGRDGAKVVGAGRFKPSTLTPNEVRCERFDAFPEKPPEGALRQLVFRYVRDETTRYQLLERGDGNVVISALSMTKTWHLKNNLPPNMRMIYDAPGVNYSYLGMNFRDERLAKLKVRQALAHAVDIREILDHRLRGLGDRATGILAPAHAEYYEPNVARYEFDPARAEKLLDEAGYPRQGPGGYRFTLRFKTTTEKYTYDMVRILAGYFRAVGIDIKVDTVEIGVFFADLAVGNFQLHLLRWIGVVNPALYSRALHSKGSSNRGKYSNPRLDALIDRGMSELDDAKRRQAFSDVQKLVAEDLPYVSLWYWKNTFVGTRDMTNVIMYPNGNYLTLSDIVRK